MQDCLLGTSRTVHPRGFGFVNLAEEWRLQEAINALHGQRMEGRPPTVDVAVPRSRAA